MKLNTKTQDMFSNLSTPYKLHRSHVLIPNTNPHPRSPPPPQTTKIDTKNSLIPSLSHQQQQERKKRARPNPSRKTILSPPSLPSSLTQNPPWRIYTFGPFHTSHPSPNPPATPLAPLHPNGPTRHTHTPPLLRLIRTLYIPRKPRRIHRGETAGGGENTLPPPCSVLDCLLCSLHVMYVSLPLYVRMLYARATHV